MTRAALAAAAAALLLAPAGAQAATQYTLDGTASFRNHPGDFVIGYAYGNGTAPNTKNSAHFDEESRAGSWSWGSLDRYAGGWYGGRPCGWILRRTGLMHANGRTAPNRCGPPPARDAASNPLAPRNAFTNFTYLYGTGGGTVYPARITNGSACQGVGGPHAYGNYDPGSHRFGNRYGVLRDGRGTLIGVPNTDPRGYVGFGVRYVAGDAVLIKDSHNGVGAPTWFFVRGRCVASLGAKFSTGLHITAARWKGRTVAFRGTAVKDLPYYVGTARQRLNVVFACAKGSVGHRVSYHRATVVRRGRRVKVTVWKARFRTPAKCATAHKAKVVAGYAGNQRHKATLVARGVRRS